MSRSRKRLFLSRRSFLHATAGALAAGTLPRVALAAESGPGPIVDCHAHIYSEDETKYPPIEKPTRPPAGAGTIAHLERNMREAGVTFVTAVQTGSFYRWDNRFTTDSSRDNQRFMAGICNLNPDDAKSPARLEEYVKAYNVRGMRSTPGENGRLDEPGVEALWTTAERLGIVVNVNSKFEKQDEIAALARRHPKLPVVLDHSMNPKPGPELEPTLKALRALAGLPNLHAKLSFIPVGSAEEYPFRDMHDICREIIKAFGPERCVWGSNFPCELWCPKVGYAGHLKIFTHELGLDRAAQRAILSETPRRLWFETR